MEEFTNASLIALTKKQKQHISTYLEKFVRSGLARRIRQEGNEIFYEVAADMRPLAPGSEVSHEE